MIEWKNILLNELKNHQKINHIEFLNKYEDIIEGPNRDSKRKRVLRFIENNSSKNIIKKEEVFENLNNPTKVSFNLTEDKKEKTISIGFIGDTHINSKYTQLTHLNKYYDLCEKFGVKDIYHTGDIDDGENMRPGHSYDNYRQGADEHIEEIIKNYPKRKGITTHFITGNHDASFRKSCGLDIGLQIQNKRDDLEYLGRDIAIINLTPKVSIMLRHPWDGTAYALSYKVQKMIEAMDYYDRPTIMAVGHYHKMEYLYYLGVHCLQTGCFQSATPYTIGKGIRTSIGGWIVTIHLDKNGELYAITPKAVTFDSVNSIKEDYKNFM